jgi:RNA polymerase-binding transcription factor DksA
MIRSEIELKLEAARAKLMPTPHLFCVDCDDPIGFQRKRSEPWLIHCLQCEKTHEDLNLDKKDVHF